MQTPEIPHQPRLRLTEARNERGLSQQELAERIGTTYVNVSRWERGITKPSPYFRRKLINLFGKTEEELDLLPASSADQQEKTRTRPTQQATDSTTVPSTALYDPAIPLQPAIGLVGREHDLAQIKQRLTSGGSVALTALNGLPGVGKTALSITLAHDPEIRAHFRDGILWAGLGPNSNMPGLLSRWGSLLDISPAQMATLSSNEAWAKAIRAAIGNRAMLLVIDDAWELEEALTFKVGGPRCAHLVTTRFPSIASHMAFGGATMIEELSKEQSIELLTLLAPQVVAREAQKVDDLVQAVGGLPLALTLMGNYLRKQAYSGPARRITAALERLSDAEVRLTLNEPHVPVESHPSLPIETSLSLQSIISVTDQTLSASARAALYALAVFPPKPNTFSEDAALAVAACSLDDLDALTDAGLLESSGPARDRYTLHQVIADYARLHLTEHTAHEHLIAYVTDYVEAHNKEYEMLELESGNILAALETAHHLGKQAELVHATYAFAPFLILRGFYAPVEQYLKWAQEAAVVLDDKYGITSALLYLGEVAQKQGIYSQAEPYFQEGLAQAREIRDIERICEFLTDLGGIVWKKGDSKQAEIYLEEGLTLARKIGNSKRISVLLKTLGSVVGSQGNFTQSETYFQEGLGLARQIGDREEICVMLMNLGTTVGGQGHYHQAEGYFQEGLILARQIGHREWTSALLSNLGEAASLQGHYHQAEGYFQEGLILARQIGHREWTSALLSNLGEAASLQGHYHQAEGYFQEGLILARQIGHREMISKILINLGSTTQKQGNYAQAEIYLNEASNLAHQIGRPQIMANVLYERGNLYLSRQELEAAESTFGKMLTVIPEGAQDLIALAQYGLSRVAAAQGNIANARKTGEISVATLKKIGDRRAQEVSDWLSSLNI